MYLCWVDFVAFTLYLGLLKLLISHCDIDSEDRVVDIPDSGPEGLFCMSVRLLVYVNDNLIDLAWIYFGGLFVC